MIKAIPGALPLPLAGQLLNTAKSAWDLTPPKSEDVLLPFVVFTLFAPGISLKTPVRFVYDRILGSILNDLYELYIKGLDSFPALFFLFK